MVAGAREPGRQGGVKGPVAFLFLGETLLVPHLWPVVAALAADRDVAIELWVATSVHEELLNRWAAALDHPAIRIRRAPGFRSHPELRAGDNPPLPPKLAMLARLAPQLRGTPVAVCAEQTSLWIPRLLPWLRTRFVKTSHGVGSMSARDDPRRRAAWAMAVPSERERATYLARGFAPGRVVATGYVKASFAADRLVPRFAADRPVVLYTPHWQQHRSSWWRWGREVVERVARDGRWNLIFAPHQRLAERAPDVRAVAASVAGLANVHVDLDSFACVDGSYTAAAGIYLGDTSSQVIEFLADPRPCVFLDPERTDWEANPSYAMWACGPVVQSFGAILPTLANAEFLHEQYRAIQADFARDSLGDTDGSAPGRVADLIRAALA